MNMRTILLATMLAHASLMPEPCGRGGNCAYRGEAVKHGVKPEPLNLPNGEKRDSACLIGAMTALAPPKAVAYVLCQPEPWIEEAFRCNGSDVKSRTFLDRCQKQHDELSSSYGYEDGRFGGALVKKIMSEPNLYQWLPSRGLIAEALAVLVEHGYGSWTRLAEKYEATW
jgi:hypothetical protein